MDYLEKATLVKGDISARMWTIAKEELTQRQDPILLVSALTPDWNDMIAIYQIDKIPAYGKEVEYNCLHTISVSDMLKSFYTLRCMVNELLSEYYQDGITRLFISEIAYELCLEDEDE